MIRIDDQKITCIILAVYNCKGYLTAGDLHGWVQFTTSPGKGYSKYLWTTTPSLHLLRYFSFAFNEFCQYPPRLDGPDQTAQTRLPRPPKLDHRLDNPTRPPRQDHPDKTTKTRPPRLDQPDHRSLTTQTRPPD